MGEEDAARQAAAALRRATSASGGTARSSRRLRAARSTPGDPRLLGEAIEDLVGQQGWGGRSAVAIVFNQWETVVGGDVGAHVRPESFDDGRLTLRAESTAWATQLRLLLPAVHRAIDDAVGAGTVRKVEILGPDVPSWVAGPRRVKGRGPRDTYG